MKICPKCKNEYREGITHCADCGCELLNEEQLQIFMHEEMQKALDEGLSDMSEEDIEEAAEELQSLIPPSNVYQNYKGKVEDNMSSAYSFFIVGALGCVIVVLSWFGLLPFYIGGKGNWFNHGIMLVFFIIFVFIGIVSAKNAKKYKELASEEADTQSELKKYMEDTFSYEILNEISAETEEEAYFKRMTYMRQQVAESFPTETENRAFIEALLDEHYDKIFG